MAWFDCTDGNCCCCCCWSLSLRPLTDDVLFFGLSWTLIRFDELGMRLLRTSGTWNVNGLSHLLKPMVTALRRSMDDNFDCCGCCCNGCGGLILAASRLISWLIWLFRFSLSWLLKFGALKKFASGEPDKFLGLIAEAATIWLMLIDTNRMVSEWKDDILDDQEEGRQLDLVNITL